MLKLKNRLTAVITSAAILFTAAGSLFNVGYVKVSAADFTDENGVNYNFYSDGTAKVAYGSESKGLAGSPDVSGDIEILAEVEGRKVTAIGDYAFINCTNLTGIVIPEGITDIGWGAFSGCTSLANISLPDSLREIHGYFAFAGTAITSITIPNGVTGLPSWAFASCLSLTTVIFPDTFEHIGMSTFINCSALTDIEFPDSLTYIGGTAFENCYSLKSVTIPESVTFINSTAFLMDELDDKAFKSYYTDAEFKNKIERDDIEAGMTVYFEWQELIRGVWEDYRYKLYVDDKRVTITKYIGEGGNIEIPVVIDATPVTEIGQSAFQDCLSIKNVIIPNGITSIKAYAFRYCLFLNSVTIPESVTEIGGWAFRRCDSLKEFIISEKNNVYSSLDGVLFNKDQTELIRCPGGKTGDYVIPNSVTVLSNEAFLGCVFNSITVPNSVRSSLGGLFAESNNVKKFEGYFSDAEFENELKTMDLKNDYKSGIIVYYKWSDKPVSIDNLKRYILGISIMAEDVNGDGVTDVFDLVSAKRALLNQ